MTLYSPIRKTPFWFIKSAFVVWLKPLEFNKRDQVAFIFINTIVINIFVLLTVWPEAMMSGVSAWFPALFGIATATPLAIVFMTLGGNSLREILTLRAEMEAVSQRLAEQNAELETAKRELNRLANCDGLTGLANRRSFSKALDRAFGRAGQTEKQVWLGMLDLDGFKAVNDKFGHDAGDSVLIGMAQRLKKTMKDTDCTIARFGGDEFAIILSEPTCKSVDEAHLRIGELQRYLTKSYSYKGQDLRVGVSIGLAKLDGSFASPTDFLKAADTALLRAKAAGKDRICLTGNVAMSEL